MGWMDGDDGALPPPSPPPSSPLLLSSCGLAWDVGVI